ncbi:MAG: response regulator transcription factor [Caldilineaceae bacterium]|nr:response regulator transcription factor [Caldilineaceae bacterium]
MVKVFVVDDHPVVRQTYRLLLRREADMECCGEAESGQEAVAKIVAVKPDIVVLDISLQGETDGVALLQTLCATYEQLPVLVVSGHDETVYAERMLRLGARGYVAKGDAVAFLHALRQVAAGKVYQRGD